MTEKQRQPTTTTKEKEKAKCDIGECRQFDPHKKWHLSLCITGSMAIGNIVRNRNSVSNILVCDGHFCYCICSHLIRCCVVECARFKGFSLLCTRIHSLANSAQLESNETMNMHKATAAATAEWEEKVWNKKRIAFDMEIYSENELKRSWPIGIKQRRNRDERIENVSFLDANCTDRQRRRPTETDKTMKIDWLTRSRSLAPTAAYFALSRLCDADILHFSVCSCQRFCLCTVNGFFNLWRENIDDRDTI